MNRHFVKYGLYAGGASVIFTLLLYIIDPKLMLKLGNMLILVLIIVFMVMAAKGLKKDNGGFISFKEAFSESWLVYLIYVVISMIFTYLLFNIIDPSLKETVNEIAIESLEKMSGFIGEEGVAKATEELEKQDSFSLGKIITNSAFSLLFGALISLIIGAALKKEKPEGWDRVDVVDTKIDKDLA